MTVNFKEMNRRLLVVFLLLIASSLFGMGSRLGGKVLVLANDRGEVHTFVPGQVLQVKVRDGSKWVGELQQVEQGFFMLGVRRVDYEAIVWLRRHMPSRDMVGKVLTGVGAGLVVGGLALGVSTGSREDGPATGAAILIGLGLGAAAAGIITSATRKKYRTRNFRMLVIEREEAWE